MTTETAVRRRPEDEELAKKRLELSQLEAELADRELALASLRSELAAFEGKYVRSVGILYAELDEIDAQIAERVAEHARDHDARVKASRARDKATESHSAAFGKAAEIPEFTPTQELKRLYRDVAKKVHPDLTSDPTDRAKRERLMSEANRAYERGDAEALNRILDEYETSPETVSGEGIGAELVQRRSQAASLSR